MSNIKEIRERLDRMKTVGNRLRDQFAGLKGPAGDEMKKRAREEGTRIGIGAGLALFGLVFAAAVSLYITYVVILLVDIALDRPWLSALIVVGGFLLIGAAIIAIGVGMAASSARKLSRESSPITAQVKQAGEELKTELEELQVLARKEAEERQKQVAEMARTAAPAVGAAFLAYRLLKRAAKSRREKRAILDVIRMYEQARAEEEMS